MTQARSERNTQKRVIDLFTSPSQPDSLRYQYLGNWTHRENNRCLETGLTTEYLTRQGYSSSQISAALQRLEHESLADVSVDTSQLSPSECANELRQYLESSQS